MPFRTVLSGHAGHITVASDLTPTQNKVDGLVSSFVEEAANPTTLSALFAGSLAYRFTKLAALSKGAELVTKRSSLWLPLVRPASIGIGLASEVTAFEFTNRGLLAVAGRAGLKPAPTNNLWSWNGPGGWREGLITSAITFGMLKGAGHLAREQNIILQHSFQSTAMVAGHQTAGVLGITARPEGSLAEQLLHAEVTNIQLQAGVGMVHAIAPGLTAMERGLDLSLQTSERPLIRLGSPFGPSPLFASTGAGRENAIPPPEKNSSPKTLWPFPKEKIPDRFYSIGSGLTLADVRRIQLLEYFRPLFEQKTRGKEAVHFEEIFELALEIPFKNPLHHERLLLAFLLAPDCGEASQRDTAFVIRNIFSLDPLHTVSGSFNNSLLQLLISQVLEIQSPRVQGHAFQDIFEWFERGPTRPDLLELLDRHGSNKGFGSSTAMEYSSEFATRHQDEITEHLAPYSRNAAGQILNFTYDVAGSDPARASLILNLFGQAHQDYPLGQIEKVFEYARSMPFGKLVINRFLQMVAVENTPEKIHELMGENSENTIDRIVQLAREGRDAEFIARDIDETHHTAYFRNISLSRKLVDVVLDVAPCLFSKSLREARYKNFRDEAFTALLSGHELNGEAMLKLLSHDSYPSIDSLHRGHREGNFVIRLVSSEEFDATVKKWGVIHGTFHTVFIQAHTPGGNNEILIREMPFLVRDDATLKELEEVNAELKEAGKDEFPLIDLRTLEGRDYAFNELVNRLAGVMHEWEHWRHSSGQYEGRETDAIPFQFHKPNRDERLLSEMLAMLEDNRWLTRNLSPYLWERSKKAGGPLLFYMKSNVEGSYFGKVNQNLSSKLLGDHKFTP